MNKQTFWAILLSILVMMAWSLFFNKHSTPTTQPTQTTQTQPAQTKSSTQQKETHISKPIHISSVKGKKITKDFGNLSVVFDTTGAAIEKIFLNHYFDKNKSKINLVARDSDTIEKPFATWLNKDKELEFANYSFSQNTPNQIVFTYKTSGKYSLPANLFIKKIYTFNTNSYLFSLTFKIINNSGKIINLKKYDSNLLKVMFNRKETSSKKHNRYNQIVMSFAQSGKVTKVNSGLKLKKNYYELSYNQDYEWTALATRYFLVGILPFDRNSQKRPDYSIGKSSYKISFQEYIPDTLKSSEECKKTYYIYAGPKERDVFRNYKQLYPDVYGLISFEKAIGFSKLIGPISNFLLDVLNFLYKYLHNYGWAIIFLTLLIKITFSPLTFKQYESMGKMKQMQPHINALKEQYKDDPQKLNTETMALYKKHKVNPLGGCLPLLLQIPVFFAFYDLLSKSIKLRDSHFFWIKNLSSPDTVATIGTFSINILPIIMGITMFLQQKMTATGDSQQQKMMMFMPLIFLFMFWNLPSGLVLYWTVQNLLSITEQYFINKHLQKQAAKE